MTIPQGIKRVICLFLAACFFFQNTLTCYGQALIPTLTPQALNFNPPTLKYLSVNSANPYNYFNFLLDKGSKPALANSGAALEQEAGKLIHYFFIGLTLPESSLWVNLRPDEPGRITSLELAQTDMGKLLLEQDLRLKKDVAQYLNPSQPIGKRFWEELYTQAELLLGKGKLKKTAITTSNRVWIVPDEAVVMETEDGALVTQAKLKVLLESEYLSLKSKSWNKEVEVQIQNKDQLKNLTEALMKTIIIPEITKEVNSGKNYAPLRQIYHSLILAQWFKQKYRKQKENSKDIPYIEAIDQSWLKGLESEFPWSKDAIWKEYLASFQKGEYQLKEKLAGLNRMYTSGGIMFENYDYIRTIKPPGGVVSSPMTNPKGRENTALVVTETHLPGNADRAGNRVLPDDVRVVKFDKEASSANDADASSPILVEERIGRALGDINIHEMNPKNRWVIGRIWEALGLNEYEGLHLWYALHGIHRSGEVWKLSKNPAQAIKDRLVFAEKMKKDSQDPKSGLYGYISMRDGFANSLADQFLDEEIIFLRKVISKIAGLSDSEVRKLLNAFTLDNIFANAESLKGQRWHEEYIRKMMELVALDATNDVYEAGDNWREAVSAATANVARRLSDDQREMVRRLSFATSAKAVAWILDVKAVDVREEIIQLAQDHWARDGILNALKEGGNADAVPLQYVLYFHALANPAWAGTRAADPRQGRNDPATTPMLKGLKPGLTELYNKALGEGKSQRQAFAEAVLMFHLDALELQKGLASLPIMEISSLGPPEVNLDAKEVDASLSILNRERIGRILERIDINRTDPANRWAVRQIYDALGLSEWEGHYLWYALQDIHRLGGVQQLSEDPVQAISDRLAAEEKMLKALQDPKSGIYGYISMKGYSAISLESQGVNDAIIALRGVIRKINGLSDSEVLNLLNLVTLRNIYDNAELLAKKGWYKEYTRKIMVAFALKARNDVYEAGDNWMEAASAATANVARRLSDDQREMVKKLSFATSAKAVAWILDVKAVDVRDEIIQLAQDHLARDSILNALKEEGNADAVDVKHVLYLHALANSTWAGTHAADLMTGRNDPAITPMLKGLKQGLTELYDKALRDGKSQRLAFTEAVLRFHLDALELQKGLASSPLERKEVVESSLYLARQGDPHAIRELLERANAMASSQDKRAMEIARQFIREVGKEIGKGLRVFIDTYPAHSFVNRIVLGGGVGENLGKGIAGETGADILIEAIQSALGRDDIKIVRSSMSDEIRAFLAFLPASEEEFAVALDIGGTNVRTALIDKNGVLGDVKREMWEFKDNPDANRKYVLDTLTKHIKNAIEKGKLMEADEAIEIGISWAGPGDYDRGIVTGPNIPGFVDFNLKGALEERLGNIYKKLVRVRIVHDGAAGAIGEYKKGALREQAGIYLILGTGIGAGIVDGQGKPIYAVAGIERNLGEIGHHLVYDNESGDYSYQVEKDGSFPQLTQGEKSFEMRLSGPALAVRFGERLLETFFQESGASNNEVIPNDNPAVNDAEGSAASPLGQGKRLSSLEEDKRSLHEVETFEELYALLRLRRTISGSEDIFATEGLIQLIEKARKGNSSLSMITRANGTRLEGLRNKVAELLFMENIQKKIEESIGRYSEDREQESLQHMKQMLVALFKELSNALVKNGDVKKLQELYNFLDFITQRLISQDEDDLKLPFTPHGIKHSLKVVEYMLKAVSGIPMLRNKLIDYYGAHYIEIITLLGLLHDIGYAELERAGNELGKVNIKKGYHADLGAEIVEERLKEFLINWFGMNNVGSREGKSAIEDFIDAILLHGADNQNVKEEGRKGSGKHVYTPASDINNPLLMLLRLGDNLDITRGRLNILQQNPWFMRILHRMFRDIGDTRMLTEEEFAYKIEKLKKEQKEKLSLRLSLARRFLRGEISRDGFYRELKNSLNGDDVQITTLANQLLDLAKNKSLVDKIMAAIDSMNHESFPHFIGALAIREVDFSLKDDRLIIKAILTPIANNENWIPVAEFQINGAGRTNKALESLEVNGETLQVVIEYGDWANNSIAGPGVFGNLGVDTIHDLVNFNLRGAPQVDGVKSKGSAASPLQSKEQAIPQLNKFIKAIEKGKYQQKAIVDLRGLPSDKKVILVGDLHARLDNFKRIINTDSNLEKIQRGEAVLVILGDAVHSETDLAEMDSSVEIMQFIMDLKIQNPDNVYYVLGNHDYLSNLFSKNGVAQGKLFRDRLKEQYGYAYVTAYENFIKESPLMVVGSGFVAVHGGPIKDAGIEEIQNVNVADESNRIVQRAQWGRYRQGYDEEDVKSFLKNMGQADGQLIVGHSPRRDGNWHWQLLDNHHIVFAGHDRVGYALVQNKKVNFVEATADPVRLELIKNQEIKGQEDEKALPRQNIAGRFIKGTKVTLNKVRLLEGKMSKIVAGYAMEGILVKDIEVGKSIILERGNTSRVENIEAIDDNTIHVRTKTSVYEVKIAENANYGDWAPKHKGFPEESAMVLPLDEWNKVNRVDLRRLPKGTLIYLGDTGTWVNYLIRIEDNGMINLWLNEANGSFYGPVELLGSYDAKTKSVESGVIISGSAIGFPYFRWKEGNLIDYKLTAELGWVQTFPFFRILYPEGSSRSSKKRIDESSSKQDESNIKLLGGQRSGGTLETEFIGDVWITAGSFVYKVSVSGDDVYFQRYEKDKLTPIGRVHSMSLNQQIQIGREDGDYRLSSDRRLSGRHFVIKISKKEDDRFSIFVEDLNSLNGTIVEWDTHGFSVGSKNSAASPLEQEVMDDSLKDDKSQQALKDFIKLFDLKKDQKFDINALVRMLRSGSLFEAEAMPELKKLDIITEGDKKAGHIYKRIIHSIVALIFFEGLPENILKIGDDEGIKGLLGEIKSELTEKDLYLLRLAILLHDIGKRPEKNHLEPSHEEHGAADVLPRILERIKGLTEEDKKTISYLVEHHSVLDNFNRSIGVDSTNFVVVAADLLGKDLKLIKMLYLLNVVDSIAVNPNKYKNSSIRILPMKLAFEEVRKAIKEDKIKEAEGAAREWYFNQILPDVDRKIKEQYLELVGLPSIAGSKLERIENHLSLFEDVLKKETEGAREAKTEVRVALSKIIRHDGERYEELAVAVSWDNLGLLEVIAGTLAKLGYDIHWAWIETVDIDGKKIVFGRFLIKRDPTKSDNSKDESREKDKKQGNELKDAITKGIDAFLKKPDSAKEPNDGTKETSYKIANAELEVSFLDSSNTETQLIITGWDRQGLLSDIMRIISGLSFNVSKAEIETWGRNVKDIFYVQENGKPLSEESKKRLSVALKGSTASSPIEQGKEADLVKFEGKISKILSEQIRKLREAKKWEENEASVLVEEMEKRGIYRNGEEYTKGHLVKVLLIKIINEANSSGNSQNLLNYISEFLGNSEIGEERAKGMLNYLSQLIHVKGESMSSPVAVSSVSSEEAVGGIDLSHIEVTLKDEKFVSRLNPADLKVLRAAKYLKEGWGSLSLLYVYEVMLLLKDNLASDIKQKGLLQEVINQLQVKGFAVPEIRLAAVG